MTTGRVLLLPEPQLAFRHQQAALDPHDGLAVFGPVDADSSTRPAVLSHGVVGTSEGLTAFGAWVRAVRAVVEPGPRRNPRIWPPFPTFESTFLCELPTTPAWTRRLDRVHISAAAREPDPYARAERVVDLYINAIQAALRADERVRVIVCVVPDEVARTCRPKGGFEGLPLSRSERKTVAQRKAGQASLFGGRDTSTYKLSIDFRRQIKARVMADDVPIQIVLESTLETAAAPRRRLTPPSDRAWNLATAMYYKAGGKPWKLLGARDGTCYVGIAFRRTNPDDPGSKTACCAAQMFLRSGDGMVFLGDYGRWYSPERRQYHLEPSAAERLLRQVLDTYHALEGKPLREVFLHTRSTLDADEFAGFRRACPAGVKLVAIRVRRERQGFRLFRDGNYPVLRGTLCIDSERHAYLCASGLKPRLATYDGWEVPAPLSIEIQHGDADIESVCADVFGLTKLNFNACRLGEAEPVTIGFSDAVGEILVSNPDVKNIRPNFRFYI